MSRLLRVRRSKLVLALVALEFLVLGAAAGAILAAGHPPRSALLFVAAAGIPIVLLTVYCIAGQKTHERKNEIVDLSDSQDSIQNRYRRMFLYFPLMIVSVSITTIQGYFNIITNSPGRTILIGLVDYLQVILQFCLVLSYAWMLTRRGMGEQTQAADDELFARHRLLGQQTGFFVAVSGVFVAYLVGLRWPSWAIALLPSVGGIAVAAAGLRFALLDRAAERNG